MLALVQLGSSQTTVIPLSVGNLPVVSLKAPGDLLSLMLLTGRAHSDLEIYKCVSWCDLTCFPQLLFYPLHSEID